LKIEPARELELEYVVKVRTFGKSRKIRAQIGNSLAKAVRLKLGPKTEVSSGKRIYKWDPNAHAGGTPEDILIDDVGDPEENLTAIWHVRLPEDGGEQEKNISSVVDSATTSP
jgi:hypothetical protein